MEHHPISVAEFLKSESFSHGVISLQKENKTSTQPRDGGEGAADELQLENSARVALLLTRSFVNLCCVSEICHDEAHHHLSSICLDDFFVNLDEDSSNTTDQQRQDSPTGPFGGCNDVYEYFNQLLSQEEEKEKATVKDRNGKTLGLGYFSFNGDAGNEETTASDNSQETRRTNQHAVGQTESINGSLQTLYGIDIIFPTRMNDLQQRHLQQHSMIPMQILGKLLYEVFSGGASPPSDMFVITSETTSNQDIIVMDARSEYEERSSRNVQAKSISVFSQLVDSNLFPISICRLLSDLIDCGPNSDTDSPFTSFDDVIQDLEQMISQPSVFLHDSNSSHQVPHTPVFGQVYYGRDKEVAKIIKIVAQMKPSSMAANVGVEAIFVSGIAGSGKSQLAQTASDYLSNLGWTFIKAKFERGAEHASRGIISSMFDEVVSYLVKLKKEGIPSDVAKCERASSSIWENVGYDGLSLLVDILPSLPLLFADIDFKERNHMVEDWQLIYALVKILEAVIESDQCIMLCCDDLQWADRTTLALITEVLTKLGEGLRQSGRCCLFIGLYREDEVDDDHPFSIQYSYLQMSSSINTTEVKLSSLSKKDVADMITAELKLPRRFIRELADVVYKKTSGHAFFVAQLLNSLLRNSTISYSPRNRRFSWDGDTLSFLQTGDSVAELIASNLSSLPVESQKVLQILSLFGIQTDIPLLHILERFEKGILSSLDTFIERGILDRAGPILIFTHDLIQQAAYESMPISQRHALHLDIGRFLGGLANIDASPQSAIDPVAPVTEVIHQLQLNEDTFYVGNSLSSSLISIACDQIDSAGPDAIENNCQRLEYAEWNLCAGQKASHEADFRAALFYFTEGIAFLGRGCWLNDLRLCLALHDGVVFAAFALGEADNVARYAEAVIKHVSFEDTLKVQPLLLKSLAQSGKHTECIKRGVNILRRLDFDIPLDPTMEIVMASMASTDNFASQYSVDRIMICCEKTVEESAQNIVTIMDAFYVSCYASGSPFLPLISFELVKYSLQHGVCAEAKIAFASYGMFRIFFEKDYSGGKKWAEIVRAITKKHQSSNKSKRRRFVDVRAHLLLMGWRYLLYGGGENLSIWLKSSKERSELIAENSDYATKYVALDNALLAELTGQSLDHFSSIKGMVCSIKDIQSEAESVNNARLLHHIHVNNAMIAYWRGDLIAAEESSHFAWTFPTAKMPSIVLIYHTFFGGLIAFQLFRKIDGGDGDKRLKEGKIMTDRMGMWAQTSMDVFRNKWLLLKAEHAASINQHEEARKLYEASINVSRDHGNIHELGLAYELLGHFCSAHQCEVDANSCFRKAYTCYNQWGAKAVAEKILRNNNLDLDTTDGNEMQVGNQKRMR